MQCNNIIFVLCKFAMIVMCWLEITVPLAAQRGQVLLGEAVHPHQVDVRILLPLELLHNQSALVPQID